MIAYKNVLQIWDDTASFWWWVLVVEWQEMMKRLMALLITFPALQACGINVEDLSMRSKQRYNKNTKWMFH